MQSCSKGLVNAGWEPTSTLIIGGVLLHPTPLTDGGLPRLQKGLYETSTRLFEQLYSYSIGFFRKSSPDFHFLWKLGQNLVGGVEKLLSNNPDIVPVCCALKHPISRLTKKNVPLCSINHMVFLS